MKSNRIKTLVKPENSDCLRKSFGCTLVFKDLVKFYSQDEFFLFRFFHGEKNEKITYQKRKPVYNKNDNKV